MKLTHLTRTSIMLAVLFTLDKALAFSKSMLFNKIVGLEGMGIFGASNNIPDYLSALLSGGALGMAFIPVLREYIDREGRSPRFFSPFTSGVDPLPNGNVLVCQASYGAPDLATRFYAEVSLRLLKQRTVFSRLFEVNRAKDVVWELITGHRGPLNCGMYQAERYSEADVRALLGAVKSDEAARGRRLKSLPYMR